MTPAQIAKKVQEGADARFDEVIERLLTLLDTRSDPRHLIKKWTPCGLMVNVPAEDQGEASIALEKTAKMIIEETVCWDDDSWGTNQDYIVQKFKEAVAPYESEPIGRPQFRQHACL